MNRNTVKKTANYEETVLKLTNTQWNKLKSVPKNKTGTTLRVTMKNFQDKELPHELFITTQESKIRNAFANNISMNVKLVNLSWLKKFSQVDFLVKC